MPAALIGTSSVPHTHTLIPFHKELSLWPYPCTPLNNCNNIVKLDFLDTGFLSLCLLALWPLPLHDVYNMHNNTPDHLCLYLPALPMYNVHSMCNNVLECTMQRVTLGYPRATPTPT